MMEDEVAEVTNELLCEALDEIRAEVRDINALLGRHVGELRALNGQLTALEGQVAALVQSGLKRDTAHAALEARVERIKRRLDLID